ncbi:MAG: hypothetical protein MUE60_12540, partial [Candidatus Eisenbacteria bacterium]|nr:hypothetical protein [Candidatus Eisenbacteria bacterium]
MSALGLLLLGGCTITDSTGPPLTDYQSVVEWYAADSSIPGVVALVARGDSIWAGAAGDAGSSAGIMDPDDKVRAASLTK